MPPSIVSSSRPTGAPGVGRRSHAAAEHTRRRCCVRAWRNRRDAPASEAGGLRPMGVRLPPPAPWDPDEREAPTMARKHREDEVSFRAHEQAASRFPSETQVKRDERAAKGGEKELVEKLGANDLCPCGSRRRFQALLPKQRPLSTGQDATTTSGSADVGFRGRASALPRLRSSAGQSTGLRIRAQRFDSSRRLSTAPWPSGEARACKARSRRFESARCLADNDDTKGG
jgi:hypothetical protein